MTSLVAGANGLANFVGDISYKGALNDVSGSVKLSAQKSRMGTIFADRTRLDGRYHLNGKVGTFEMAGNYVADSASLAPSMFAGVTGPLAAAARRRSGRLRPAWRMRSSGPRATSTRRAGSRW